MANRSDSGGPKGLSVRQLTLIFLGAVGVCALFFALGYLVGTNNRPADSGLATEQVPPPGEIPPTVNPPVQYSDAEQTPLDRPGQGSVIEQNINSTPAPAAAAAPTAPVKQAPPPAAAERSTRKSPSTPAAILPAARAKGLMIQVSASHAEQEASTLVRKLKSQGYSALLVTPEEAGAHDRIYRIQVGPYATRRQAMQAMERLGRAGFKPFIKE
ncbi:MAG: SPOR domain-containing protein [Terriglobia bacterium]